MSRTRFTPPVRLRKLPENGIFVFGSNLAGHHGGGAAADAVRYFGAIQGRGEGIQGRSYAIPTMQGGPETIRPYVDRFIKYAGENPELTFYVTPIGCGIAGRSIHEMAPLFRRALDMENVLLPRSFCCSLYALELEEDSKDPVVQDLYLKRPIIEEYSLAGNGTEQLNIISTDMMYTHFISKTKEGKYGLFEYDIIGYGMTSGKARSIGDLFAWDELLVADFRDSYEGHIPSTTYSLIIALRSGQNWYIISLTCRQETCFIAKGNSFEEANNKLSGIVGIDVICWGHIL